MLARPGRFSLKIGAALLVAVVANAFSAEAIRSPSELYGPRLGTAILLVFLAFMVLRNLPFDFADALNPRDGA